MDTVHLHLSADLPALAQRPDGRLLLLADGERPLIELVLRTVTEPAAFDRSQNYLRFPLPDGRVRALDAVWHFPVPTALIEHRRQQRSEALVRFPDLGPYAPEPDLAAGILRIGVPLALVGDRPCRLDLRLEEARVTLHVDGVLVDEEWPLDLLPPGGRQLTCADRIAARLIPGGCPLPAATAEREDSLLPHRRPFASYWAPPGHNLWAADTMMASDGERLHVLWLRDRHMHSAKWGCGVAGFWHHSSADLRSWTEHPPAWELQHRNIAAIGTSTLVHDQGRWWAFSNMCNDRLPPEQRGDRPAGTYVARSDDGGEHFTELGYTDIHGEMGILRDPATGIWHGAACATRLESDDLRHWRVADRAFLPPDDDHTSSNREGLTVECYGWFRTGGWHYIYGGRTGFWMSRDLLGPYWAAPGVDPARIAKPRWKPYDGLVVPQICSHRGRIILSGWTGNYAFGGHLVFRELVQEADGTLASRFLEETMPPSLEVLPLAAPTAVATDGEAVIRGVDGPVRLRMTLTPNPGCQRYGLLIGAPGSADGLELRCEPGRQRVQWGERRDGRPAREAPGPMCHSEDYALMNVACLNGPVTIDLVMLDEPKSGNTIVDVCLNGQRTMLTRRRGLPHGQITLFAEDASLGVAAVQAHRLDWR